jgi:hypothetical protein
LWLILRRCRYPTPYPGSSFIALLQYFDYFIYG